MIKRNLLKFGVIVMVSACLVGCGDDNKKKSQETTSVVETTTEEETTSLVVDNEPTTEIVTEEVTTEAPTTEAVTEKATEPTTEKATEKATEKKTQKPTQKPAQKPTQKPVETTTQSYLDSQVKEATIYDALDSYIRIIRSETAYRTESRAKEWTGYANPGGCGAVFGKSYLNELVLLGLTQAEAEDLVYNKSGVNWGERAYEALKWRFSTQDISMYTGVAGDHYDYSEAALRDYLSDCRPQDIDYAVAKWLANPTATTPYNWFEECKIKATNGKSTATSKEEFISHAMHEGFTYEEAVWASQFFVK